MEEVMKVNEVTTGNAHGNSVRDCLCWHPGNGLEKSFLHRSELGETTDGTSWPQNLLRTQGKM